MNLQRGGYPIVHAGGAIIPGLGEPLRLFRPWPEQYLDFKVIGSTCLGGYYRNYATPILLLTLVASSSPLFLCFPRPCILTRSNIEIIEAPSFRTEQKPVGQYFVRETAMSQLSIAFLNKIVHLAI